MKESLLVCEPLLLHSTIITSLPTIITSLHHLTIMFGFFFLHLRKITHLYLITNNYETSRRRLLYSINLTCHNVGVVVEFIGYVLGWVTQFFHHLQTSMFYLSYLLNYPLLIINIYTYLVWKWKYFCKCRVAEDVICLPRQ